jgi:hypothetical protein
VLEEHDRAEPEGEHTTVRRAAPPETANELTTPIPQLTVEDLPTTSVLQRADGHWRGACCRPAARRRAGDDAGLLDTAIRPRPAH